MDRTEQDVAAGDAVLEFAEAVKDDLDAALDGLAWTQNRPVLGTARTGPGADATTDRHYTFGVARPLGEDEWDRAIAVVAAHARRVGYTGAELVVDRVEDHEARFYAADGRALTFGTAGSTIFRVSVTSTRAGAPGGSSGPENEGQGGASRPPAVGTERSDAATERPDADADTPRPDAAIHQPDAVVPEAEPDIIDEVPRW